jgi:hypothetical protein
MTPSGTAAANPPPATTYHLALGDSLAFGYPSGVGYADDLEKVLQFSSPGIQLIKLGCPGEFTVTMINGGGPCAGTGLYEQYGGSTNQLDAAISFPAGPSRRGQLPHHRHRTERRASVHQGTGHRRGVRARGLDTVRTNLPAIFGELRQNLDGETETAGMTFYDPFLAL